MTDQAIPADKKWPTGTADKIMDWCTGQDISLHGWQIEMLRSMEEPPLPTLADMTPEERTASVGRWCEFEFGALAILQQVGLDRAYCVIPNEFNLEHSMRLERLTPRFDLPRAWNPDGTPAPTAETPPVETVHNPSSDAPRKPDPQPGEAWLVECDGKEGAVLIDSDRDAVTTESGWINHGDYRPITRLVPETPRTISPEPPSGARVGLSTTGGTVVHDFYATNPDYLSIREFDTFTQITVYTDGKSYRFNAPQVEYDHEGEPGNE